MREKDRTSQMGQLCGMSVLIHAMENLKQGRKTGDVKGQLKFSQERSGKVPLQVTFALTGGEGAGHEFFLWGKNS